MNKINIAFSTDSSYVSHTAIAMASILLNCKKDAEVNFLILSSGLIESDREKFSAVKKIRDCNIIFKNINQDDYKKYFPNIDAHYTLPVYYRFLIPQLFPDIDKVLYLDGDLIVKGDVSKLFNTDLENYPIAMCEDFNKYTFNARLGMDAGSIYYNAGVMLLNCKTWRAENFADKLFEFALKNREYIEFPIQDALNPCMEGRVLTLDKTWNCQVYQTDGEGIIYNFDIKKDKANIIHYIGKIKPWSQEALKNSFFEQYFIYKDYLVMDNIAPIALFVYNRADTLKQTVEALKNNILAEQSELFVFADGEKTPNDPKVKAVRDYIKTIDGFKSITIIEQEKNIGLSASIVAGVTKIVNDFGKIIVIEDDVVTSPYFLKFANDALVLYENDDDVACITGYTYPINEKLPQTFFLKGADCWGWATWKRGWDVFEADGQKLLDEIKTKKLENEFDFNDSYPYVQMLQDHIDQKVSSWDVCWLASAFLNNKLCLYLGKSIIQNIGFANDGTHCRATDIYDVEIDNEPIELKKIKIDENKKARRAFEKFFKKITGKNTLSAKTKSIFSKSKKIGRKIITVLEFIKTKYKEINHGKYGFSGDYKSWQEVEKLSEGYSSSDILEKTLESTLKVKNGEAVFERDSFIFDKIQYSWALLACLFKVAAEHKNELNVLDFGGALGSHYFQNKEFLKPIKIKKWTVVEQEHYVNAGNEKIADGVLNFVNSIDKVKDANVLILSSVLQYLPDPYEWLEKLINKGTDYIIIDRTAFSLENRDRLTLQVVPPSIYDAKYPAWFLDEKKFLSAFAGKYDLVTDFDVTIDRVDEIPSIYKGYFFKKVKNA